MKPVSQHSECTREEPGSACGEAPLVDLGRLAGTCAFISDVHLEEPDAELTRFFLQSIQELVGKVDHLFLVGDLFEFIDVGGRFFRDYWTDFFAVLRNLKENGMQIYFVEGNHDFGFAAVARRAWLAEWSHAAQDACFRFLHPHAGVLHVRHGDDVVTTPAYLKFRYLVKSSWCQWPLRLIPGRWMHRLCIWFAQKSRARGNYRPLPRSKLVADLQRYASRSTDFDALVIGHIHVHTDARNVGARAVSFFSGPDWHTSPSYLLLQHDGTFERVFLQASPTQVFCGTQDFADCSPGEMD